MLSHCTPISTMKHLTPTRYVNKASKQYKSYKFLGESKLRWRQYILPV